MSKFHDLAVTALAYAEKHYGDRDARFDVIVECMSLRDVEAALEAAEADTVEAAIAWAKSTAGLQHEQELNAAWDGPESVKSSSLYDPAHDPAGHDPADFCPECGARSCKGECPQMAASMARYADWHRDPLVLFNERHGL